MKILEVVEMEGHVVLVQDGDEIIYYERRSADDWRFSIGESLEASGRIGEIEALYQARLEAARKLDYEAHQAFKRDW